jgi:hypothetical protein
VLTAFRHPGSGLCEAILRRRKLCGRRNRRQRTARNRAAAAPNPVRINESLSARRNAAGLISSPPSTRPAGPDQPGFVRGRLADAIPTQSHDDRSGVRVPQRPYRSLNQPCWLQIAFPVGEGIGPGACEQTSVAAGPPLFAAGAPELTATIMARAIAVLVNMVVSPG